MNIYYQQPKLDLLCSQCETNISVFLKDQFYLKKIIDRVLDKFFLLRRRMVIAATYMEKSPRE